MQQPFSAGDQTNFCLKQELLQFVFPNFSLDLRHDLASWGRLHRYEKGQVVMNAGQTVLHMQVILEGGLKLARVNENGFELVLAYINQGQAFGESLTPDSPTKDKASYLTVAATENTLSLVLAHSDKDLLAKRYENWYRYLLQSSFMYQTQLLELVDFFAFKSLDSRVKFLLKQLCRLEAKTTFQINSQDIAGILGIPRRAVVLSLEKFAKDGLLRVDENCIVILQRDSL